MAIRIAIVGYGKIARDQHAPSIARSADFELVAVASRNDHVPGLPAFGTIAALLESDVAFDAVALCQPPQARFAAALAAIRAGKHVFLEKPPGATLSEVEALAAAAREEGVTLFASWHSRFAPGVAAAKAWLAANPPTSVEIVWKEDVRHWHPGQQWIWEAGGLGVFDPGINALSILTEIMPEPVFVETATLAFPGNRQTPIAADIAFACPSGAAVHAEFDWRHTGHQTWDIRAESPAGTLLLSEGGSRLSVAGAAQSLPAEAEYAGLYARFATLIAGRRSEVDVAPLRHVADAFLRGERRLVEAFEDVA